MLKVLTVNRAAHAVPLDPTVLGLVEVTGLKPHRDGVSAGVVLLLLLMLDPRGRVRHSSQRLSGVVPGARP